MRMASVLAPAHSIAHSMARSIAHPIALSMALSLVSCGGGDSAAKAPTNGDAGDGGDAAVDAPSIGTDDFIRALPASCAFDCTKGCPDEKVGPFACPSLDDWSKLPHDDVCGAGPKPPRPSSKGACTASEPTGEAIRKAGAIAGRPGAFVLPDGHRITPAGSEIILTDTAHVGGFPVSIALVPSTRYAIVVEAGFGDHLVRSIDRTALASGAPSTIVSTVTLPRANWGAVVGDGDVSGTHRILVSGGDSAKVYALTLDDATGALTLDDVHAVALGTTTSSDGKSTPFFSAGIAATHDGKRLIATSVASKDARMFSLQSADYGAELPRAELGKGEQFGVAIDPLDVTSEIGWVSLWGDARVVAVSLATGAVTQSIAVGKDPEGVAFLDARWMVVAAADGDVLTLVDRVAGAAVTTLAIAKGAGGKPLHGWSPTALAYDRDAKRLYVAESVINAVEAFDVDLSTPTPTLTSKGRIPTSWWPTDLAWDATQKRLLVVDGRGHGTGSGTGKAFGPGDGEIAQVMRGSVQSIDVSAIDLVASSKQVDDNAALADTPGYPKVSCPSGSADFPVPATNTEGASKRIKHVLLVIRENKNFDGVLGDVGIAGVDGEPSLVLSPGHMDELWTNFRAIARTWTVADDYYTDAEFSSQGHVWATYGRTTDFTERVWMIGAAGKGRALGGGVTDVGRAEEGSIFEWLLRNKIEFDILGEGTGLPAPPTDGSRNPLDGRYPGIVQNVGLEDVTKSCYFAARARVLCDLHSFVYLTLPNDHTFGGGTNRPTPETMIAVNDEATGVVLDALSHSPIWQDSLVIITEDDPQDGADHVDLHRTPIVFAGPFVKRGYVAHGHYDVASLIKLLAHLSGLPYPNEVVARAPLPLEMFTSTADDTPYTFHARTWERACNGPKPTSFSTEAAGWDWDEIDEQPGLGTHLRRMLRATPEARGVTAK